MYISCWALQLVLIKNPKLKKNIVRKLKDTRSEDQNSKDKLTSRGALA